MKLLKYLTIAFMLLTLCTASQAQTTELSIFLGKLKRYEGTHQIKNKWAMSVIKPADSQAQMPSPPVVGYMEDTETGLRYFPRTGRIYDPETSFVFDIQTGKIYKGKSEIKLEKHQST